MPKIGRKGTKEYILAALNACRQELKSKGGDMSLPRYSQESNRVCLEIDKTYSPKLQATLDVFKFCYEVDKTGTFMDFYLIKPDDE